MNPFQITEEEIAYLIPSETDGAKILFLDHELSTNQQLIENYGLKLYYSRMSADSITRDYCLFSTAWAWEHECQAAEAKGKPVRSVVKSTAVDPSDPVNDRHIVETIWHLLNEADWVIGHNLDRFDTKKFNTRALKYRFPPPSTYKTIDTLKIAYRNFGNTSNKLGYMCDFLELPNRKSKSPDWGKVLKGDPKEIKYMEDYNVDDIPSLRDYYHAIRAWDKNGINLGVYKPGEVICPACGGNHFHKGKTYTRKNGDVVNTMNCADCGHHVTDNYKHKKQKPLLIAVKN